MTHLHKPTFQGDQLKALVFDVDGTLYRQQPLRRSMLFRLLGMLAANPVRGWETVRVLREDRRAQELLRVAPVAGDISSAQIRLACERANVGRESAIKCVTRWMEQEPLAFLSRYIQPGVLEFLQTCRSRGLRLGVLSDYPAEAKLDALGLTSLFDVVVCSQAADINAFKPSPRGLVVAVERLSAVASETLYVGDRADVDAPTAAAAGVHCAILAARRMPQARGTFVPFRSFSELSKLLWP